MSDHTPGPWKILQWADQKKGFIAIVNEAAGTHICDVFPFGTRALAQSLAVHEADARLIAAAPDLLDALKQIICVCGDNQNAKHIEMAVPFIEEIASAAVAKAERVGSPAPAIQTADREGA